MLAAVAGCGQGAKTPPASPPAAERAVAAGDGTVEVRLGKAKRETPSVGVLKAKRTTRLGPQVSGRIAEVLVKEGDAVTAGQELARLDTTSFDIEVALKQADVDVARIALAGAELQYTRFKGLWDKPEGQEPTVSRKAYDEATIAFELGKARVKQAEEAVRKAKNNLAETVIRAPYDGVVTRRLVDPGEPVTSAPVTHIVEVQETASLDLEFLLPQPMLARVGAGTLIAWDAEGLAGDRVTIPIEKILPDIDEATRSFRCRATVANPEGRLRPGMLARVRVLEESAREALFVPSDAVSAAEDGSEVRIIQDGKPAARTVKTGERFGDFVEIVEGLTAGDRIVVPGSAK